MTNNYLKVYRKKTPLHLRDVSFLVGFSTESTLSRYEQGSRDATIEILLFYEILFDKKLSEFYEPKHLELIPALFERLNVLKQELVRNNNTGKNTHRINYLHEVIIRIKDKYYD